jgi:selenoprotein W-related protein
MKRKISSLTLIPATGGCFELMVDNELIYSKLATGDFPIEATLIGQIESRVKKSQ